MSKRYQGMCKGCKFWDESKAEEESPGHCQNAKAKWCVVLLDGRDFLTWQSFGCRFYDANPSTGEMLEFFNALCEESSINFLSARNQDKVLALRRLIEHGPEVSMEIVDKRVQDMVWDTKIIPTLTKESSAQKEAIKTHLIEMLAEIPVTVKED